ncbi:unnamed protein product [Pleuronectes platessa]|uniref:Uncharacterized protein n=1 Tax=Pleuronectes platessa TaxID=8262 RepID=A0A9N7YIW1_PLEPL|nr:unnamed protein product [Pleuronectes platessa]
MALSMALDPYWKDLISTSSIPLVITGVPTLIELMLHWGPMPWVAFSSLAEVAYEATDAAEDQEEPAPYWSPVCCPSDSGTWTDSSRVPPAPRLRGSKGCLEIVVDIKIKNSAKDCYRECRKTPWSLHASRTADVLRSRAPDKTQFNDLPVGRLLCHSYRAPAQAPRKGAFRRGALMGRVHTVRWRGLPEEVQGLIFKPFVHQPYPDSKIPSARIQDTVITPRPADDRHPHATKLRKSSDG